jgi:hypothetical protein
VLANAFTRVVFRVGDADARSLENGFSHFEARDLQNLEIGEAVCRIERSDFDFNLAVRMPEPAADNEDARRAEVIAASRAAFGCSRSDIEAEVLRRMQGEESTATPPKKEPKRAEEPPLPVAPIREPAPRTETSSEKGTGTSQASSEATPRVPREPADLGRGGAQHQAIQLKIKSAAEEAGFRVKVEENVNDRAGSIDLMLEKDGSAIACEINVTSTIDYEVRNVGKCLKAGFERVAVICPRADRLFRLEEAVRGCFATEDVAKVRFYSPDDFIASVKESSSSPGAATLGGSTKTRRRGYKVRRSVVDVPDAEAKAREETAIKALAEKLRRPNTE